MTLVTLQSSTQLRLSDALSNLLHFYSDPLEGIEAGSCATEALKQELELLRKMQGNGNGALLCDAKERRGTCLFGSGGFDLPVPNPLVLLDLVLWQLKVLYSGLPSHTSRLVP